MTTKTINKVDVNLVTINAINEAQKQRRLAPCLVSADFVSGVSLTEEQIIKMDSPFVILEGYELKPTESTENNELTHYEFTTVDGVTKLTLDKDSSAVLKGIPKLGGLSNGRGRLLPFRRANNKEEKETISKPLVNSEELNTIVILRNSKVDSVQFLGDVRLYNCSVNYSRLRDVDVNVPFSNEQFEKGEVFAIESSTLVDVIVKNSELDSVLSYASRFEHSIVKSGSSFSSSYIEDSVLNHSTIETDDRVFLFDTRLKDTNYKGSTFNVRTANLEMGFINLSKIDIFTKFDYLVIQTPGVVYDNPYLIRVSGRQFALVILNKTHTIEINDSRETIKEIILKAFEHQVDSVIKESIIDYVTDTIASRLKICAMLMTSGSLNTSEIYSPVRSLNIESRFYNKNNFSL